jgi:hypothetical protein
METSIFIARILAICYISFGLGLVFSSTFYKREIPKLVDNPALLIYGGLGATILGYLLIHYHNRWVMDWTVVITIIGWIALLKGITLLVFPESYKLYKSNILHERYMLKLFIPITLIVGLYFAYFGFVFSAGS